jgi:hypothetical protein
MPRHFSGCKDETQGYAGRSRFETGIPWIFTVGLAFFFLLSIGRGSQYHRFICLWSQWNLLSLERLSNSSARWSWVSILFSLKINKIPLTQCLFYVSTLNVFIFSFFLPQAFVLCNCWYQGLLRLYRHESALGNCAQSTQQCGGFLLYWVFQGWINSWLQKSLLVKRQVVVTKQGKVLKKQFVHKAKYLEDFHRPIPPPNKKCVVCDQVKHCWKSLVTESI